MTAVERLFATARAEIGYLEKESNAGLWPRMLTLTGGKFIPNNWCTC